MQNGAILKNPAFPWIIVFIFGCLIIPQNGCQLELPRMLTLRAMSEHHTFEIGNYVDWTDEWSRTPDGRYFNNRAPGPVLIPFPAFYIFDKIIKVTEKGKVDEKGRRPWPGTFLRVSLSFLFQEIPFSLLVMIGASWMLAQGISLFAIHFFTLAALFGNTAAIFMNNWSGHGITATFVLGVAIALLHRRYFWVGLCYGSALLCDYCSSMLLLPLLLALFVLEKNTLHWLRFFILGGILPGILWIWYHVSAFGSPFIIANHYQNPAYLLVQSEGNFLGQFMPIPSLTILFELLFGARRGLLPTQPWVLLAAPIGFWMIASKKFRKQCIKNTALEKTTFSIGIFSILGLFFLIFMNTSYGGWHGGNTSGPRYICAIMPALALFTSLYIDSLSKTMKIFFGIALGAALLFRGLVFAINPVAPLEPLWQYLWLEIIEKKTLTNWLRLGIYLVSMGVGFWYVLGKQQIINKETRI